MEVCCTANVIVEFVMCTRNKVVLQSLEKMDLAPFMNELNLVPCINKETPKVIEYSFLALRQSLLPDAVYNAAHKV
jgi:hypothetical protein